MDDYGWFVVSDGEDYQSHGDILDTLDEALIELGKTVEWYINGRGRGPGTMMVYLERHGDDDEVVTSHHRLLNADEVISLSQGDTG